MKKLFLFILLSLLITVACKKSEEIVPEQPVENKLQLRASIKTQNSDFDPTTHDDFPDFEYEDGYDSSTSPFIYKALLIEFVEGTTEAQKNETRNKYSIEGLNGWELFHWEKCDLNPNVEFWSVRMTKEEYNNLNNNGILIPGPGDGIDDGDDIIICTAKEIKIKKCEPQ